MFDILELHGRRMNSSVNESRGSLFPGGGERCDVSASDHSQVKDIFMMVSIKCQQIWQDQGAIKEALRFWDTYLFGSCASRS